MDVAGPRCPQQLVSPGAGVMMDWHKAHPGPHRVENFGCCHPRALRAHDVISGYRAAFENTPTALLPYTHLPRFPG